MLSELKVLPTECGVSKVELEFRLLEKEGESVSADVVPRFDAAGSSAMSSSENMEKSSPFHLSLH
jgi:hypothetical protein